MTLKKKLNCLSNKDTSLREKILEWYDKNGRHSLPWKNQPIYLTWISEIMLQQTQVKTVIPYFKKFKKKIPNIKKAYSSRPRFYSNFFGGTRLLSQSKKYLRSLQNN